MRSDTSVGRGSVSKRSLRSYEPSRWEGFYVPGEDRVKGVGVETSRWHRRATALTLFLVLSLLGAACGDSNDQPEDVEPLAQASTEEPAEFPVTIEAANGSITISEQPQAIVSISPTATEMLFAIGAGEQVIAVDDRSYYPPEAPVTNLSGFEPNVEAIAGYIPDLVVLDYDPGEVVKSLEKIEIPVLVQPAAATLDDTYAQLEALGEATGRAEGAEEVIGSMQAEIETIVASVPDTTEGLTYYHELDPTYYSATSETFIGQVYSLLGLENIADEAPKSGSGYPQLSQEYILDADPDLIFLADTKCCDQTAEAVADRPGWDQITAVANGGVIEMDEDIASRWGPRVVDFLQAAADAVIAAGAGSG